MKPKKLNSKRRIYILNRVFALITILLFCSFLIFTGVMFFVLPKSETSVIEKRKLTEFPSFSVKSLISGEFTDKLTLYVSDNFAFREKLVNLSFTLENLRGLKPDDVKIYSSDNQNQQSEITQKDAPFITLRSSFCGLTSAKVNEEQKPAPVLPVHNVLENKAEYADLTKQDLEGEKRGALFMIGSTALEIFYGNESVATDYSNVVNSYRYALPSNVRVFDMVVPSHFEFGLPTKYRDSVGRREKPYIDGIYSRLDANITAVDAYSSIEKHYNNGEYLYFRTDHHWTALGAYYAYTSFAKSAGFVPLSLESYENGKIDKFLGTFYASTCDKMLESNPDYVEYYLPSVQYDMTNYKADGITTYKGKMIYTKVSDITKGYYAFMNGDIPCSVTTTINNTGRSIIVFKESYGNAFIPFLLPHYDKIYVADIRTFPFNALNYITDNSITDVLFLNNIMTSCTPARIANIQSLITK